MSSMRTVLSCIATAALLALPQPSNASDNDARVLTEDAGAVTRLNPHMPWRPVAANGRVAEVVQLRCEKRCTVQADQDNTIELDPGAIVAFRDHFFIPLVPLAPMTRARQVELVDGRITVTSSKRPTSKPVVVQHEESYFATHAGRAELFAKGSTLNVTTREAVGRVANRRAWSTIEPNHSVALGPAAKPEAFPNPAKPEWDLDAPSCEAQPLSFAQRSTSGRVGACWKAVEGAHAYRLEFSLDPDFSEVMERIETDGPSWIAEHATGRWFGRIRAVDQHGFESMVSDTRAFGVIPIDASPGSIIDIAHHALVIPETGRIQFSDPMDVQIAIDKGAYHGLPGTMRPEGDIAHRLRFRYEGQSIDSASYELLRRQLRANIELTPRVARWPSDAIDIVVRLEDPSGNWNPVSVEPRFQVLVGLTEMNVEWARSGATWVARIPPRDMAGPVVLRVIARDEFGQQIGRNFLEVAYDPRSHQHLAARPNL